MMNTVRFVSLGLVKLGNYVIYIVKAYIFFLNSKSMKY